MRKNTSILFLFLIFTSNLFSQVTEEWVARYNGSANLDDMASSIALDNFGNIYITGYSRVSGSWFDYTTIKYDSNGIQLWVAQYNGPYNDDDYAYSIAVDSSGNVYVTGCSMGGGGFFDYATVKYNSAGVQQWVQRYDGSMQTYDVATSIVVDQFGNVFVTGESFGNGTNSDYTTIKYDPAGVEKWVARYNGPSNRQDQPRSMAVDSLGNIYVTGFSYGNGHLYNCDYATVKYNTDGVQLWVARYDGPVSVSDYANSITLDDACNVYVTGESDGNSYRSDYATVKYDSSGNQKWVARYSSPSNYDDCATSIVVDISGNVYVTGCTGSLLDYTTVKYNSSGVQQWVMLYSGPGNHNDVAVAIVLDIVGNVYVTGTSWGSNNDYATVKYSSSGMQLWSKRYDGPGNDADYSSGIVVDNSGNVFITGSSRGNGTGYDIATIKYSQSLGIQPISTEIPNNFSLYQNYPNPFNPVTKIKFNIPTPLNPPEGGTQEVRIVIYDVLGREIAVLVNQQLKPGTYEIEWSATGGGSNYPSGVYFYKLISDGFSETKKMVLLK